MRQTFRTASHRSRQRRGLRGWGPATIARRLLVAVVGLTLACSGSESTGVPSKAHPIVLTAVDGLRADHLGCYGHERGTSPSIDALARESVLFEWAFAQAPESVPSLVSILTGLYPTTHDVLAPDDMLREEASTLAEVLSDRGYTSAAVLAGGPSTDGLGQGFGLFDAGGSAGPQELAAKALAWLEDHASKDFLLVVRPPGPGPPLTAGSPAPEDLEHAKAVYDGEIRSLDAWIGEFMKDVRRLGLDRRATIALVATHGRGFQEHGAPSNSGLHPSPPTAEAAGKRSAAKRAANRIWRESSLMFVGDRGEAAIVEGRLQGHGPHHLAERAILGHVSDATTQLAVTLQGDECSLLAIVDQSTTPKPLGTTK